MKKAVIGSLIVVLVVGGGAAAVLLTHDTNGGQAKGEASKATVTKPLQDGKVAKKSSYSIP